LMLPRPPLSTLSPYTTLFRSGDNGAPIMRDQSDLFCATSIDERRDIGAKMIEGIIAHFHRFARSTITAHIRRPDLVAHFYQQRDLKPPRIMKLWKTVKA